MSLQTKTLHIKTSKIPNAGRGCFAKRAFKAGELIAYFKGDVITMRKANKISNSADPRKYYFVDLENGNILDVYDSPSLIKYANDAEGLTKMKGLSNNSEIRVCSNRKMAYVVATKNIPVGSEIFLEYGEEYWNNIL